MVVPPLVFLLQLILYTIAHFSKMQISSSWPHCQSHRKSTSMIFFLTYRLKTLTPSVPSPPSNWLEHHSLFSHSTFSRTHFPLPSSQGNHSFLCNASKSCASNSYDVMTKRSITINNGHLRSVFYALSITSHPSAYICIYIHCILFNLPTSSMWFLMAIYL